MQNLKAALIILVVVFVGLVLVNVAVRVALGVAFLILVAGLCLAGYGLARYLRRRK